MSSYIFIDNFLFLALNNIILKNLNSSKSLILIYDFHNPVLVL